jgi:hypothetical protein
MRWFGIDVSGPPVGTNLTVKIGLTLEDGTDRLSRNVVFKAPHATITQKTEEFTSIAAEAYDLASLEIFVIFISRYKKKNNKSSYCHSLPHAVFSY